MKQPCGAVSWPYATYQTDFCCHHASSCLCFIQTGATPDTERGFNTNVETVSRLRSATAQRNIFLIFYNKL